MDNIFNERTKSEEDSVFQNNAISEVNVSDYHSK